MQVFLEIYKMEIPWKIRVKLLRQMGELINYQYASNITEDIVETLIELLREDYE